MKEFNITFMDKNNKMVRGIFKSESEEKIKSHMEKKGFLIIMISTNLK